MRGQPSAPQSSGVVSVVGTRRCASASPGRSVTSHASVRVALAGGAPRSASPVRRGERSVRAACLAHGDRRGEHLRASEAIGPSAPSRRRAGRERPSTHFHAEVLKNGPRPSGPSAVRVQAASGMRSNWSGANPWLALRRLLAHPREVSRAQAGHERRVEVRQHPLGARMPLALGGLRPDASPPPANHAQCAPPPALMSSSGRNSGFMCATIASIGRTEGAKTYTTNGRLAHA